MEFDVALSRRCETSIAASACHGSAENTLTHDVDDTECASCDTSPLLSRRSQGPRVCNWLPIELFGARTPTDVRPATKDEAAAATVHCNDQKITALNLPGSWKGHVSAAAAFQTSSAAAARQTSCLVATAERRA